METKQQIFYNIQDPKPIFVKNLNPRYKTFTQSLFTIGDEEQWRQNFSTRHEQNEDLVVATEKESELIKSAKLKLAKKKRESLLWNDIFRLEFGYLKLNQTLSSTNTFKYIFHNLKKGIFVRIENNKLVTFLPFSKYNFRNNWGKNIIMENNLSFINLIFEIQKSLGKNFSKNRIFLDPSSWTGNNHIFRYERPAFEGDSNMCALKHMFQTLCNQRKVPDIEFFLNRRDSLVLRKDRKFPYLIGNITKPDYFGNYAFSPILSMCSHEDYEDIAIPTWNDWERIAFQDFGIFFCSNYRGRTPNMYPLIDFKPWNDKISQVIFRGSSTGKGVNKITNKRMKAVELTNKDPRFDVKISALNLRPRYTRTSQGKVYIDTVKSKDIQIGDFKTSQQQSEYKYILNIEGHSCAFRLSQELAFNSVILYVKTDTKLWFFPYLDEYVHYVPVKEDLSDLISQLEWCEENPEKCQQIAKNALDFYNKYLGQDGILDMLALSLSKIKEKVGDFKYNEVSAQEIISSREKIFSKRKIKIMFEDLTFNDLHKLTESKTSIIYQKDKFLIKVPKNKGGVKSKENLHEIYICRQIYELIRHKDNFLAHLPKCIGKMQEAAVFQNDSDLNDVSLFSFIPGECFNMNIFYELTIQIMGVLQFLIENMSFVHNDLYPWNIMVSRKQINQTYISSRGSWQIKSNFTAKLIDFGKSHIVNEEKVHMGCEIHTFDTSSSRDLITFIVSSSNLIINTNLTKYDLSKLFYFINFLAKYDSSYTSEFCKVSQIKHFTKWAKKYTQMMYSDKGLLKHCYPVDLVHYLAPDLVKNAVLTQGDKETLHDENLLEEIFTCPFTLYENICEINDKTNVIKRKTLLWFAKILSTVNNNKHPRDEIYRNILQKVEELDN